MICSRQIISPFAQYLPDFGQILSENEIYELKNELIGGIFLMRIIKKEVCVRKNSPVGGIFSQLHPRKYPIGGIFLMTSWAYGVHNACLRRTYNVRCASYEHNASV